MSFFRYPGGKSKLKKEILPYFPKDFSKLEYREPFLGAGSLLIEILKNPTLNKIWINDKDVSLANLWTSVVYDYEKLEELIKNFLPTVKIFKDYSKSLKESTDPILLSGFKKLAIHQMSYSGLGLKAGGPIGGLTQNSKYLIDCRWSPNYILRKTKEIMQKINKLMVKQNCCTSLDFESLVLDESDRAFIYLDPPYYEKGKDLYIHSFSIEDHIRLSSCLKKTKHMWVLSYDDCDEIKNLYDWADVKEINVNYSITSKKNKTTGIRNGNKKKELIILPRNYNQ